MTTPKESEIRLEDLLEHFRDPKLYCNRELSLLAFQERVLEEARNPANPLLERIKFLAIFGSNMDEFFMVRVAGLQQKLAGGGEDLSIDGRNASDQLQAARTEAARLTHEAYRCWETELLPALAQEQIHFVDYKDLTEAERIWLDRFFKQAVFPVLTPLGYDPGRPFPHISSLSVNLAVLLRDRSGLEHFARVKIPDKIDQLVALPPDGSGSTRLVWLEQVVEGNLGALFPGTRIVRADPFRITRDAEVEIQELESDDLLETIEEAVWRRRFRQLVRLELNSEMPPGVFSILANELDALPEQISYIRGPLDLKRLWQMMRIDRPELKNSPLVPATMSIPTPAKGDIFSLIRSEDILLHHPFESFQPVVDFLRNAAIDPHVLAIKMTLYRVGKDSPIVESLLTAVQEGKQVSVLVELKARFDEESNIEWAKALESNGVHVVYGLVGLKVHSKIALVVRREADAVRKYVHLGTGNYNPTTARLYTDMSLFTCDEAIGDDAVTLFNRLTGYSEQPVYHSLIVAPQDMRPAFVERIEREIERASRGEPAFLRAKMNALDDAEIIRWLYAASSKGVKIDLLVRGICALRPGIQGISENIRVRSIVGRFLEHSRIFLFHNGGEDEVLLGSADWMTRNLAKRVEVVFPLRNRRHANRMIELLDLYWSDNVNARDMQSDGSYVRAVAGPEDKKIDSQAQR